MVQRPTPGSPLSISANALGDAYEAGESYQQRKRLGQGLPPQIGAVNPAVVRVRNDSGSDLAAGAVVEIGLSTLTALDRQNLWFSADVRSGDDPFCAVLLEPIPYGKYGNAQVAGVCIASVNVIDTDNTHARAVPGETTLKGDFGGWCRILYKPSGTGVLQCVVLICGTESVTRKIKTTSSIPAAGSGTANFYIAGSDRDELTVYHNWADDSSIATDTEIYARYLHDEDKWIAIPPGSAGATYNAPADVYGSIAINRVYQDGSSTADTSPYQLTTSGLWCFPNLEGITANDIGTSIIKNTPTSSSTEWVTLYQASAYVIEIYTTWALPSLSLSNARSLFRGAAHDHTYTDNGAGMTTGAATPDLRSLDDGGVVSVTTYLRQTNIHSGLADIWMGNSSLRPFYDSAGGIHYANHCSVYRVPNTAYRNSLRIKVVRDDTTSYVAPELHALRIHIRQSDPCAAGPSS